MAGRFVSGHLVPVSWTPTGGVGSFLNIKEHNLDISALLHDVTGWKAGGVRARIAGPIDIAGRVVCDMDLDEPPFLAPPLLLPGVKGITVFGVSTTVGIQCPLILEKYHQTGGTDKELMWDADWKANSLAGYLVYPAL